MFPALTSRSVCGEKGRFDVMVPSNGVMINDKSPYDFGSGNFRSCDVLLTFLEMAETWKLIIRWMLN